MTAIQLPKFPFRPGERVCVAISGGGDSTALMLMLHASNNQTRSPLGIGLSAVHINHSLRGEESDGDQAFVEQLCASLAIPLRVQAVATAARATAQRETLEEAAHALRYEVFRQLIEQGHAETIATAHTLDDQAETVLMKLLRGAWLEGLSGISPTLTVAGGRIVRPLLDVRRDDLRLYLTQQGQIWREDSTNDEEAFTRNRLRHTVLPILRAENASIDQTLANLAELAREEEARWAIELDRLVPQLILPGSPVRGGGRSNPTSPGAQTVAMELDRLRALDPAVRRRVVRTAARQLGTRLNFAETSRLLTLAGLSTALTPDPTVAAKPGAMLRLASGLMAERSLRELRLSIEPTPTK